MTVQLLPHEEMESISLPLGDLACSARGHGIPALTHEQAWASLEEHEDVCSIHPVTLVDSQATARRVCAALSGQPASG